MNLAATNIIANSLTNGVTHPGDGDQQPPKQLQPLPGFNTRGIPPEMQTHFANEAGLPANDAPRLYAEALIHALETDGELELVPRAELEQLRAEAATLDDTPKPGAPTVSVRCHCNRRDTILDIGLGRAMVITDGAALKRRLNEVCTCE